MIIGVGTDLIEIARMAGLIERRSRGLQRKVFTEGEWRYAVSRGRPGASLAARFAAKEAVIKALGGRWRQCRWREIEVVAGKQGPSLLLHGQTATLAGFLGITRWQVSLAHSHDYAMAFALAEGLIGETEPDPALNGRRM